MDASSQLVDTLTFRDKAFDSLQDSLRLLRSVKYNYAKCGERCYTTDNLPDRCMVQCNTMHDVLFKIFNTGYQQHTVHTN